MAVLRQNANDIYAFARKPQQKCSSTRKSQWHFIHCCFGIQTTYHLGNPKILQPHKNNDHVHTLKNPFPFN